ncbi:unnamed protein product [Dracunculus medinensis]|uniref:Uncharacterized protein n=1 Tax=Dracunculus medinensis TaxID=318479 RepID=A0A0N4UHE8_DRAME|nr:unnamed protein product [Dracunculus medinensis]
MIAILLQVQANKNLQNDNFFPFNLPSRWNCEEILQQNLTLAKIVVYARSHMRIPAMRCNNITRVSQTKQPHHRRDVKLHQMLQSLKDN